jgi:hypothetical protein
MSVPFEYRKDLARAVTRCGVRGLLTVCRRFVLYPTKQPQKACFYWRFVTFSAIAQLFAVWNLAANFAGEMFEEGHKLRSGPEIEFEKQAALLTEPI